ncbi:MAG TPA: CsbD family protein [Gemmatimonadales bacterium]
MNRDWIEGNWKQVKGKVRERWGKLTDDDLDVIAGRREQLIGRIQELYGTAKTEIERELDDMEPGDIGPREPRV